MAMSLPKYAIVGKRPVKALRTVDGGMTIRSYDWQTEEFKTDMSYLTQMVMGYGEITFMDKESFDSYVAGLRRRC
jgi:hypothetical protein